MQTFLDGVQGIIDSLDDKTVAIVVLGLVAVAALFSSHADAISVTNTAVGAIGGMAVGAKLASRP